MACPRVAFLPDTFHEVNGVAHTSRQFEGFALRRQLPFLSLHCGPAEQASTHGSVRVVELKRGPGRIQLDAHLEYDPFLMRHANRVIQEIKAFRAELIHLTGPGDMGTLGWYAARRLKLPLVISWHTSLHEYAGRRLERVLSALPRGLRHRIGALVERFGLQVLAWFYRSAAITLAPNQELIRLLRELTEHPVFLMQRGVDTALFTPQRRHLFSHAFRIGYVGRLSTEKNVRFLAELSRTLRVLGRDPFEFVIVGQGREAAWLHRHMPDAIFTGVLRGERLAEAYASFDLFVFPSKTDTFGNVVLEALASGVPVIATGEGGPKFLVENGVTGFVGESDWDFIAAVNRVMTDPALHHSMRLAARQYACRQSWDCAFKQVLRAYEFCRKPVLIEPVAGPAPLLSSRLHERDHS